MMQTTPLLKGAAGALFCFGTFWGCASTPTGPKSQGWGVDACLTAHVDEAARIAYLPQLKAAGVTILRERGPNPAMSEERAAGFRVVSFLGLGTLRATQPGDALPEDLLAVFNAAKSMQQKYGPMVDAWEIGGEPDVGYCTDLPDRYVAFEKAVYLGIKSESEGEGESEGNRRKENGERGMEEAKSQKAESRNAKGNVIPSSVYEYRSSGAQAALPRAPVVLMGALALPPGPWLERAARNGLFDYTDACNFHFYGYAEDLTGVIRAHEAFAVKWMDRRDRAIMMRDAPGSESDLRAGWDASPRLVDRSAGFPACSPVNRENCSSPSTLSAKTCCFPHSAYRFVISAYRHLLSAFSLQFSAFPIWITECGINAVPPDDFLNPERRQLQAEFTVATARQALEAKNVAVFMPFILAHSGDPHALTVSADRPLPAWIAYADFTRQHPFPSRMLALPPRDPNPVVVQWLPDNQTTIPHKVSGTYRFRGGQPILGVLRIYNFGREAVRGVLAGSDLVYVSVAITPEGEDRKGSATPAGIPAGAKVSTDGPDGLHGGDPRGVQTGSITGLPPSALRSLTSDLRVPPMGKIEIPVSFVPKSPGYFREYWQADFVDDRGRRSPVYFGLEAMPQEKDFVALPMKLEPPGKGKSGHRMSDGSVVTSASGAWVGTNELVVIAGRAEAGPTGMLKAEMLKAEVGSQRPEVGGREETTDCALQGPGVALKAWVTKADNDPLRPTMAVARIKGLPLHGFLRLQLDQPMNPNFKVRVDLVDRQGQRFTIWENFGASYFGPRDDVWLNLEDFHVYFWGQCSDQPDFHPENVEEIQLRFYIARENDPRRVKLTLMEPRNGAVSRRPGN